MKNADGTFTATAYSFDTPAQAHINEGVLNMTKLITLEGTKTYATKANAIKAVEKKFPLADQGGLRYFLVRTDEDRFYLVFVGQAALDEGVHFHFNVVM